MLIIILYVILYKLLYTIYVIYRSITYNIWTSASQVTFFWLTPLVSIVLLAQALPCCATTAAVWSATVLAGASLNGHRRRSWPHSIYNYCTVVVRGSSIAEKHHQQPLKLHAVGEDPLLLNLASHAFPTRCWEWKDVRSARDPRLDRQTNIDLCGCTNLEEQVC